MERLVYNRDFVERNFSQQTSLKGVFTLGEQEADTLVKIEATKCEIDKLADDIKNLSTTLQGVDGNGGKKQELYHLEFVYIDRFWLAKQKYDAKLGGGLEGFRANKKLFKDKVLSEALTNNAVLYSLVDLETRAETVFSSTLARSQTIDIIQSQKLLSLEHAPILRKRVIGKEDVDIASIIKKLNNSDWVRQGILYYETNDGICPFCQQKTSNDFSKSLSEYFDETFEQDNAAINALMMDYITESKRIQQQIKSIIDLHSIFIDGEKLESESRLLDSIITTNIQRLARKKKEASQIIELDSLKNVLDEIATLITFANKNINAHNIIVSNIANERKLLTLQIWRFIIEELKNDINDYSNMKKNIAAAISNLEAQLQAKNNDKRIKESELSILERQIISIQPTLDGINRLLASFGFKNFSLAKGNDGKTYKLVRANGSDARDTLSDGERNFVTFLYFYYLLKGSQTENGINVDKTVVFDDPVSSLDSDILSIVSSLIRELFDDMRKNRGTIKQIFIFTHNIYFHKELTFNSRRNRDTPLSDESFWIIKKRNAISFVERYTSNPIKTSYELLWEEVRSERHNNVAIQNTLRRILENYFKLLGGISLDELFMKFEGDDKIKFKALCSWVNDGSHSVFNDDHYTALDDTNVARYLQVFKQIFEKSGQIAHYDMMMDGIV
ncbi:MAG: AAA family ATPase [Bacteroidales bacterium]|nr:AAA family ATPase [Bacteroidales bacterium]